MEKHEIRQLYGRKAKSKLVIERWGLTQIDVDDEDHHRFLCEVEIYNDGDIGEESYKVNLIMENFKSGMNITWHREKVNYDYTLLEKDRVKISANSNMPIFPQETLNVLRFTLDLPKNQIVTLNDVKVTIILFYSNGEDKMDTDLLKLEEKIYSNFNQRDN
ncbi:hypothetical protein QWY93_10615 [Echinicola jeungdonensis]|uniref:Uncharacterized protein n=1 Tax=Echinicola jeungdonensis TaxID=709343 RepID=A0ABV5J4R5_9BACT|nr:hypothetical protein [Echinicola jeungdonensis]MDN3669775.1 hypothetical protein [Echinicola jeungdonensis]